MSVMHPDLAQATADFDAAQARLQRLAEATDEVAWTTRPTPGEWSIDECVAHITLTNGRFLPILDEAADTAPLWPDGPDGPQARPFRRDLAGWFLSWMMEPPVRIRLPTGPAFEPPAPASRAATLASFDAVQAGLRERLTRLDGFDITTIRITSPFNASLRYSAWSAICILAAHERRHLWQAERVLARLQKSAAP